MGKKLAYAPSIMQEDTDHCYLCGRCDQKLDRHEPFNGPYRSKSAEYGMWVTLCHERCHFGKAHKNYRVARDLKKAAQKAAMEHYIWSTNEFIWRFGKNWL